MENTGQSLNEGLTHNTVNSLSMAARGIKIGAILSLVWVGLITLNGIYTQFINLSYGYPIDLYFVTAILGLASTAIFIIPILNGFKFSSRVGRAIAGNDQQSMAEGFDSLKKVGKTVFIFSIIKLALWIIGYAIMSINGGGYGLY